jgi:hypothetical protein
LVFCFLVSTLMNYGYNYTNFNRLSKIRLFIRVLSGLLLFASLILLAVGWLEIDSCSSKSSTLKGYLWESCLIICIFYTTLCFSLGGYSLYKYLNKKKFFEGYKFVIISKKIGKYLILHLIFFEVQV